MDLSPILISLKVASAATLLTLVTGLYLAFMFTRHEFKGKQFLEVLITLPMVLPPSVIGYGLLIIIGKRGPVSIPLMYQSCKAAFLNINHLYEHAARTLGAGEKRIFWRITLPMAWPGIASGIVLSFARSLGEFGATLMVAGNISGKTETIPLAIYFAVESSDIKTANTLMAVVVVFSFVLIYSLNYWVRRKHYG